MLLDAQHTRSTLLRLGFGLLCPPIWSALVWSVLAGLVLAVDAAAIGESQRCHRREPALSAEAAHGFLKGRAGEVGWRFARLFAHQSTGRTFMA